MLNMNPTVEADAAKAAQRPLAGSGAGAFTCEGTWTGSRAIRKAAAPALPRIRRIDAANSQGHAQAGPASRAYQTSLAQVGFELTGAADFGSGRGGAVQHFNQMTRIPVIPGGLGPHPAREPDPV
jgi:hypothetical protein